MDGLHILLLILLGIFILVVAVLVAVLILCKKNLKNQGETKNTPLLSVDQDNKVDEWTVTKDETGKRLSISKENLNENVIIFPPPKGNENLGNTCFFNSVLQALYYTKSFKEALLCLKPLTRDSDNMALTKNVIALLEKQTIQNEKHRDELKRVLSAVRRM